MRLFLATRQAQILTCRKKISLPKCLDLGAKVMAADEMHAYRSRSLRIVETGLTSLFGQRASPERLLEIVRSAWGIENGLHHRRDVTFHLISSTSKEDR